MSVSVSGSVNRAFEVIEVLETLRRPASATEIASHLSHAYSSVVAVLHKLSELGYLNYDRRTRLYVPTHKLSAVGVWINPGEQEPDGLRDLVLAINRECGYTTAISSANSIFANIVYLRKARCPVTQDLAVGLGMSLCRSTVGHAILSQMSDEEIKRIVLDTITWARRARADQSYPLETVRKAVHNVRVVGASTGIDWPLKGLGTIAYPLEMPGTFEPLAVSVVGPSERIRADMPAIRATIERHRAQYVPARMAYRCSA